MAREFFFLGKTQTYQGALAKAWKEKRRNGGHFKILKSKYGGYSIWLTKAQF